MIGSEPPSARHPGIAALLRWFEYSHLPAGKVRGTSQMFFLLAHDLVDQLGDSSAAAELTTGLRKLLEAKDCAVRAAIAAA